MKQERYYTYTADYIKGMVPHYEKFVALADVESIEAENKRLNDICSEKSSEIYKLRGEKMALEQENKRLRGALEEIAVQVGVHFDKRYTMNGFLAKDEHGEMCYFNDILNHLEQYTKRALEGK
jgi:hypothetical protein